MSYTLYHNAHVPWLCAPWERFNSTPVKLEAAGPGQAVQARHALCMYVCACMHAKCVCVHAKWVSVGASKHEDIKGTQTRVELAGPGRGRQYRPG